MVLPQGMVDSELNAKHYHRMSSNAFRTMSTQALPLVRAKLEDGSSVVGVRVCPEELTNIRYALQALDTSREVQPSVLTHGSLGDEPVPADFQTLVSAIE